MSAEPENNAQTTDANELKLGMRADTPQSNDFIAFFVRDDIRVALNAGIREMENSKYDEDSLPAKTAPALIRLLRKICNVPHSFDRHCQVIISNFGNRYIRMEDDPRPIFFDEMLLYYYRLSIEAILSGFEQEDNIVTDYILAIGENKDRFSEESQRSLEWADKMMPVSVTKHILAKIEALDIKTLTASVGNVQQTISDWNTGLEERVQRVNELSRILDKHQTAYNFVALVHSFDAILLKKKNSATWLCVLLVAMAIAILLPIMWEFYSIRALVTDWFRLQMLLPLLPAVPYLGIMIYFFRVVLGKYTSIQSQIVQLELRKALCACIQDYANYAKDIKTKSGTTLDRFEQIIFSGIVTSDEKIPSAYDGMEQIVKLASAIKKGTPS